MSCRDEQPEGEKKHSRTPHSASLFIRQPSEMHLPLLPLLEEELGLIV